MTSQLVQNAIREAIESSELGGYSFADVIQDVATVMLDMLAPDKKDNEDEAATKRLYLYKTLQAAEGLVQDLDQSYYL